MTIEDAWGHRFDYRPTFADGTPLPPEPPVDPRDCQHLNMDSQPADLSVGFEGYTFCEDCGADL